MYINKGRGRTKSKHTCFSQDMIQADSALDLHTLFKQGSSTRPLKRSTANLLNESLENNAVGNWLSLAAEKYQISPKLEDYVCVPVVIMPSDLPNRNCVAFPYKELTAFNPNPYVKKVAYKTWEGAPTFYEHQNDDYTKAKGVVFASTMSPIQNAAGNLYKITALCGFDRTKDVQLYARIMQKTLTTYSMGAYVDDYVCSICGKSYEQGGCNHVDISNPRFQVFDTAYGPKLAYYEAIGICGFEVSAVETPAYVSAQNDYLLTTT